jgi:hypothetical protein
MLPLSPLHCQEDFALLPAEQPLTTNMPLLAWLLMAPTQRERGTAKTFAE